LTAVSDVLVVTGLSGAGRSLAADHLEDLGWFVIDNLPAIVIEKVVELGTAGSGSIERLALAVGAGAHQEELLDVIGRLRRQGHRVRILFLEASDEELVRRYGSTKRKHPLGEPGETVLESIHRERLLLQPIKELADLSIDTTDLNTHQLRDRLAEAFATGSASATMQTSILSFGYKHGLPLDADLVLDVRFLPNPFWVDRLRELTGLDEPVREYVLEQALTAPFLEQVEQLLLLLLPAYVEEGKSYLTIAVGCTGGRHRSVVCSEELARRLRRHGHDVTVRHRDRERR
jgi:RNase adapter protein RapZ